MKAVCIDLRGQEGELDGQKFDVIVVRRLLLYSEHIPSGGLIPF
jgi:hypothetical protein